MHIQHNQTLNFINIGIHIAVKQILLYRYF